MIAAAALASTDEPGATKASRKRAVVAAMKEVAEFLGNTPALARLVVRRPARRRRLRGGQDDPRRARP